MAYNAHELNHSSGISPERTNPVAGEEALWRAVITQALMDAASQSKKPEQQMAREQARRWLTKSCDDFNTVCDYAGMEPAYVRRMAKQALMQQSHWRAEAGKSPRYTRDQHYKAIAKAKKREVETKSTVIAMRIGVSA